VPAECGSRGGSRSRWPQRAMAAGGAIRQGEKAQRGVVSRGTRSGKCGLLGE